MLFKSLRERILVFFSLLILGVQLVSFIVVNRAGADAVAAQQVRDAEQRQRMFTSLASAELSKIDVMLQSLVATSGAGTTIESSRDANSQANAGSRAAAVGYLAQTLVNTMAAAYGHSTQRGAPQIIIAQSGTGGGSHIYIDGSPANLANGQREELLASMIVTNPAAPAVHERRSANSADHTLFKFNNHYYLASSVYVDHQTGGYWLALAQHIKFSFTTVIADAFGAQLKVVEGASLKPPIQAGLAGWQALDMRKLPFAAPINLQLLLSNDRSFLAEQFERQKIILMLLIAGALLLTLLGGYALADELTRPLKALTKAAMRIKSGEYDHPVEIYQSDEIGQLAGTIAHMCERVAEREEKITRLAYADALTGLPNRALFDDRLNRAVSTGARSGASFSVILMDMDRFKYINDVLGHESGDYVLKQVASRLVSVLRESDTVARLGGDEFAMLLTGGNDYHVMTAINKILEVFEEPVNLNNQPLDIACSLGIANYPEHGKDASLLLRRADIAMYAAKRLNSGYAFYDPECDQHQQEHLSLLGDIKRAVEHDELQLYYQPKISIAGDATCSVETLLRWQHPRRGLVPPQEFIPFAEQTGAIRLITRWLLKHALKQCGVWCQQGLNIQMSLNISARDLLDPDFPEIVSRGLEENNVPPAMLCMEITESAMMQDPAKAKRTIEVLHSLGINMSIDDYGTGYSSLAYVKNLPVNELKIDREFVKNMIHSEEDSAIVKSTIELGHNLGMRVVAEGIEQDQELELLKSFGCDQGQGFLISHALTAADLEIWLHQEKLGAAGLGGRQQQHVASGEQDQSNQVSGIATRNSG